MKQPSALICMSSFKGSLSNREACDAVAEALASLGFPHQKLPIGDGGRGTLWCVQSSFGGEVVKIKATGPLNKALEAEVLCIPDSKNPHTLYIESSETCGQHLVPEGERDPMRASSYGMGEVIRESILRWKDSLKKVFVGLGDSAISDAGMGMLSGMGFIFYDEGGRVLWGNAMGLRHARTVKLSPIKFPENLKFTVLCDVLNPLCGPNGSARTFAPQKGATVEQVRLIEQGMENFANLVQTMTGRKVASHPMTGSAGGLAAAFLTFLNAELVQGARFLFDWTQFDKQLDKHGFLITGEGRTDNQTLSGKAPWECLERARRLNKRSLVISGSLGTGHKLLLNNSSVLACVETGMFPNPRQAVTNRTKEILSDKGIVEALDYSSVPVFLESSPKPS